MPALPVSQRLNARGKRGSVIVLVLVFIVLLTFIVVAFLEEATSKIKYYALFHNRDDLRTDAYSALEITLATINQYREIEGSLWGPAQGWQSPLEDFGFVPSNATSVRVSFEDESAKLSLANLDYDSLVILFDVLGFDLRDSQALSDGLIDWTDGDDEHRLNGFDGDDYKDMSPPYRPANAAIESWDEFRLIKPFNTLFFDENGTPLEVWSRFREAVSLYHKGEPNINQASYTVLEYLQEKGILDMRSYMDYRNGPDGEMDTEDDRLIRAEGNSYLAEGATGAGTEIELLRVKVEVFRGQARFELEVLVSWSGSDAGGSGNRWSSMMEAVASGSGDSPSGDANNPVDSADTSASAQRRRARGETRTAPSTAAELGYPFRFLRLTENRKF